MPGEFLPQGPPRRDTAESYVVMVERSLCRDTHPWDIADKVRALEKANPYPKRTDRARLIRETKKIFNVEFYYAHNIVKILFYHF